MRTCVVSLAIFATGWFAFVGGSASLTTHPVVLGDELCYLLPILFGYRDDNFARWETVLQIPSLLYFRIYSSLPVDGLYGAAKWLNAAFIVGTAFPAFAVARLYLPSCLAAAFAAIVIAGPTSTFARYLMPESLYYFGFWCVVLLLLGIVQKSLAHAAAAAGAAAGALSLVKPHALGLALGIGLFILLRRGTASSKAFSIFLLATGFIVVRSALAYATAHVWEPSPAGPAYGAILASARLELGAIPIVFAGHFASLSLQACVPLAAIAFYLRRPPVTLGEDLRDLILLSLCILAALVAMTVHFSASVHSINPEVERLTRLNGRYYAFALPLAVLAYAVLVVRYPELVSRRWLAGGGVAAAVSAVLLIGFYEHSIVDYAELGLAIRGLHGVALLAAVSMLTLLFARLLPRHPAQAGLVPIVWWATLLVLTSLALNGGPFVGRAPLPTEVDRAMTDPRARALVQRSDGIVLGTAASALDTYRVMFHLSSLARGRIVASENAVDANGIPPDVNWLLLLPGVTYRGPGTQERIGPLTYVRLGAAAPARHSSARGSAALDGVEVVSHGSPALPGTTRGLRRGRRSPVRRPRSA